MSGLWEGSHYGNWMLQEGHWLAGWKLDNFESSGLDDKTAGLLENCVLSAMRRGIGFEPLSLRWLGVSNPLTLSSMFFNGFGTSFWIVLVLFVVCFLYTFFSFAILVQSPQVHLCRLRSLELKKLQRISGDEAQLLEKCWASNPKQQGSSEDWPFKDWSCWWSSNSWWNSLTL